MIAQIVICCTQSERGGNSCLKSSFFRWEHILIINITSTAASAALIDPLLPEWFDSLSISDMGEFEVYGFKIYLFKGTALSNLPFLQRFS